MLLLSYKLLASNYPPELPKKFDNVIDFTHGGSKISAFKAQSPLSLLVSVGVCLSIVSVKTFKWKQFPNKLNDAVE